MSILLLLNLQRWNEWLSIAASWWQFRAIWKHQRRPMAQSLWTLGLHWNCSLILIFELHIEQLSLFVEVEEWAIAGKTLNFIHYNVVAFTRKGSLILQSSILRKLTECVLLSLLHLIVILSVAAKSTSAYSSPLKLVHLCIYNVVFGAAEQICPSRFVTHRFQTVICSLNQACQRESCFSEQMLLIVTRLRIHLLPVSLCLHRIWRPHILNTLKKKRGIRILTKPPKSAKN